MSQAGVVAKAERALLTAAHLALAIAVATGLAAPLAHAQVATPSTEQMIEQLKPPPRTRGLGRNLVIERAPPAGAPAAAAAEGGTPQDPAPPASGNPPQRPSLSLLIQFGFDSVEVQPESQQALQNLAQALRSPELAASRFVIEGHTDARGRRDYNVRLSQRRADAVRDLLARHGVDATRLMTAGKGPDEPAEPADPYAAANRRVRVVNLD